ncbi:MAG TPA: sensor histidine kinase [Bryobacteraceae bacterium]|nr:sensor histidine kinase [Bryobacteraceae bacterium]
MRVVFRAVLGCACVAVELSSFGHDSWLLILFTAVFALYSLTAMLWPRFDSIQSSLAALFCETAFFAIFSAYGSDRTAWIGSFFFLYLMMVAVVNHDWGDVFIVVGVCLGFFGIVHPRGDDLLRRVVLIAGLLASALSYQKRKLQQWLGESVWREEGLRAEMEKIRDAERQRIAGDFHDGPLQSFIAMQVRLEILGTLLKRDPATGMQDLRELQELSKSIVSDVRSFLRSMRPAEVDASDLVASVRRIVEYFQKDTGITARFVCSETSIKVMPESSHETLQILREALHNVQKHSKASRVAVSLEQNGKAVELAIDDDGTGFAFSGVFNLDELDLLRLGPASIKRRVRSLGGELVIESRPGHGAGLKIRIPG